MKGLVLSSIPLLIYSSRTPVVRLRERDPIVAVAHSSKRPPIVCSMDPSAYWISPLTFPLRNRIIMPFCLLAHRLNSTERVYSVE
ncbi:Hypothetical protein NTJ_14460 [Nesidiocoris tenuis]|uniref:Secreted protein n=1 Tax=Nesidiocoris tenuis TaxID=355587 RepID=A0ABN7BD82_9HEMI|nr:Hypothetical protein NTJ_14460 [Nesidiocoris tenuis]